MNRLRLVLEQKAFRRNAQPLEKSNVPRGLGKCPNKQNEQSGIQPDCSFLQNFMKFALLADAQVQFVWS
jgi:hypothetical protein